MVIGKPSHSSVEDVAGTVEAMFIFEVDYIFLLANDGTADIKLNFDQSTTQAGTITLKPGEALSEFPRSAGKLYVKSISGSQPFRAWGVK